VNATDWKKELVEHLRAEGGTVNYHQLPQRFYASLPNGKSYPPFRPEFLDAFHELAEKGVIILSMEKQTIRLLKDPS
jgi:hypothetical protein